MSFDEINDLRDAVAARRLYIVVGTGVSLALTNNSFVQLSWRGLIASAFSHAKDLGKISTDQYLRWRDQIASPDIDEMLAAAEFAGQKLGAPDGDLYADWLTLSFTNITLSNPDLQVALRALARLAPICTLNYDTLLEDVLSFTPVAITEMRGVAEWMNGQGGHVLHLHGHWRAPASCVLGVRDYQKTIGDDTRDLVQRALGSFNKLLFIGCGDTFSDPNFTALTAWLRSKMKGSGRRHTGLVKEADVDKRLKDTSWQGFLRPLSFGSANADLAPFLESLATSLDQAPTSTFQKSPDLVNQGDVLIDYRNYIIRECGQLTIEGIKADLETAQRKFDLEKLFVPLLLDPIPPERLTKRSKPEDEIEFAKWAEANPTPTKFSSAFAANQRLVLMALPGGGKSTLLKRLAVAYSDINRRNDSSDQLPDLDLFAVLIRCREWRDHIKHPIANGHYHWSKKS